MGFQRRQKLPQGQIHCFFWAVQRAVGQAFAANRHPKATSMAFYGRPSLPFASPSMPKTLQTPKTPKTPKRPHQWHPKARSIAFSGRSSVPFARHLQPTDSQGHINGFFWRPTQAKATPRPDPVLFLGGPACRSPGIRSQRASQGHINGFLWASSAGKSYPKARSIAFSGRSSVPLARHSQPTGIPRPHPALNASKASNRYKPGLKRFKGFKPLRASMASHGLPAQAKATPRPDPLLFHPKATSMASSGRPSLPFATP